MPLPPDAPAWLSSPPDARAGALAARGGRIEWDAERRRLAFVDDAGESTLDLGDDPLSVQLSRARSREGRKLRHVLYVELRLDPRRLQPPAATPPPRVLAAEVGVDVVNGLPWQERAPDLTVDGARVQAMVAAMADAGALRVLEWRPDDAVDPDERRVSEADVPTQQMRVVGGTAAPPGGRKARKVMNELWITIFGVGAMALICAGMGVGGVWFTPPGDTGRYAGAGALVLALFLLVYGAVWVRRLLRELRVVRWGDAVVGQVSRSVRQQHTQTSQTRRRLGEEWKGVFTVAYPGGQVTSQPFTMAPQLFLHVSDPVLLYVDPDDLSHAYHERPIHAAKERVMAGNPANPEDPT